MDLAELHRDRARAESFGSVAELYDRYRPGYPDDLLDDLAALEPTRTLDVGCGTGKAAVALAARGLSVLGVEVDERMARRARSRGIAVEVAPFESWDDLGRRFELLVCGQAWHWIDPERGTAKAAHVLHRGGALARFWNSYVVDEPFSTAFDAVYRTYAPEVVQVWRPPPPERYIDPVATSDAFSAVETRTYRWGRTVTADEWVGASATVSDHLRLGPIRLDALLTQLRRTIVDLGGVVHAHYDTHLLLAHRR